MAEFVLRFDQEGADQRAVVGGKSASLARLTRDGFPVPAGFTVRTEAYERFLEHGGLGARLSSMVSELAFDDPAKLEHDTGAIRMLIETAEIPDQVRAAVIEGYRGLGDGPFVAVRSSGTAEDMETASFAGLHDTYLHIQGEDDVMSAVRRCWASMWTARATAYRAKNGLDHLEASIAVLVQTMIDSEVSGVMFTANPLTVLTDEVVINAAWGLGEGIVSGILTPDEFRVRRRDLHILGRTVGNKDVLVIRDPRTGKGTTVEPAAEGQAERSCLTDQQIHELSALGLRVAASYDDVPQDIEWALADGELFVLQSRDITGAQFTWDDELEDFQLTPDDDQEVIWSGTWAAEYWTGAITPLFYTLRGKEYAGIFDRLHQLWGFDDLRRTRWGKYRRGTVFYNTTTEEKFLVNAMPRTLRAGMLGNLSAQRAEIAAQAPFDTMKLLRMQARVHLLQSDMGVLAWFAKVYDYLDNRVEEADGPGVEGLKRLDDGALMRHLDDMVSLAEDFIGELWNGFFTYASWTLSGLGTALARWYEGDNAFAFQDLVSGLPKVTNMAAENHRVWELADEIRRSPELRRLFDAHQGPDFFAALHDSDAGRAFTEQYATFVDHYGHRGMADRDIYYARRQEDPWIDYNALRVLLSAENAIHPRDNERKLIQRREASTEDVLTNIRAKSFGGIRCEVVKTLISYVHRFLILRDDERWWIDKVTMSKKRACQEIGRRLVERGVLHHDDDFYFLSQNRLYALLRGQRPTRLDTMKIAARRDVFEAFLRREEVPPAYLIGNTPADLDTPTDADDAAMIGMGTSRGVVVGRACVVPTLDQIGRLKSGDILVCNATDPGWASAFMIIGGLVIETGGMLAHGSCLSREYGLPAVRLAKAMQRIEDGATISVNGDTGEVKVLEGEDSQLTPASV